MRATLLGALAATGVLFAALWLRVARAGSTGGAGAGSAGRPTPLHLFIGFLTDFLDTLGIGSFATTTSLFRFFRLVPDEHIPGTLNAGHALPTILEALLYVALIEIDVRTLACMIAASVAGAWLGAGVVSSWSRRRVQIGMGAALLAAAGLMIASQLDRLPGGGDAVGLHGARLAVGVAGNFVLGALMTLGIGLYAPCMILISLLGMNPKAAFPIMMGSCAFLMPFGSMRFITLKRYDLRASLGLTLGGIAGVLLAAYAVQSLPLGAMRWLVVAVVVYTAAALLRSARAKAAAAAALVAIGAPDGDLGMETK